jgi:hypothetical protein
MFLLRKCWMKGFSEYFAGSFWLFGAIVIFCRFQILRIWNTGIVKTQFARLSKSQFLDISSTQWERLSMPCQAIVLFTWTSRRKCFYIPFSFILQQEALKLSSQVRFWLEPVVTSRWLLHDLNFAEIWVKNPKWAKFQQYHSTQRQRERGIGHGPFHKADIYTLGALILYLLVNEWTQINERRNPRFTPSRNKSHEGSLQWAAADGNSAWLGLIHVWEWSRMITMTKEKPIKNR